MYIKKYISKLNYFIFIIKKWEHIIALAHTWDSSRIVIFKHIENKFDGKV